MNILFASSEMVPFSKTGGLADVAGALPPALAAAGNRVTVMTPLYGSIDPARFHLSPLPHTTNFYLGDTHYNVGFYTTSPAPNLQIIFVDCPPLFHRDHLYGTQAGDYPDNGIRFGLFAKAITHWVTRATTPFQILHLNDWQTGMVPLFLQESRRGHQRYSSNAKYDLGFRHPAPKIVFTIHNLGYHGLFSPEILPRLGLGWEHYTMEGLEFWGQVSFIKAGLIHSDLLTTVSPTYSREIQTQAYGFGLDGVLRSRADKLTGVINGVDYQVWNPETDRHIIAPYSARDLRGKAACKEDLQGKVGLPLEPGTPVIGMVSRIASQKGFDILIQALDRLLEEQVQLVILGNGDRGLEEALSHKSREERFRNKLAVVLEFNNERAHQIEAGADMFLMPSRYEPCGLNQLYSLRYGTVPIVRATGGLDDTVEEFNPQTGAGTGFKFTEYSGEGLLAAVHRALRIYGSPDRAVWEGLMINGMKADFSWGHSAQVYEQLYRKLLV